jgi:hypothetical protein
MDVQTLQTEIRDYLLNQALNDLSIIRWTLVEERIHHQDGAEYMDALLAYRDAELASLRADKEYRAFLVKDPAKNWEEEERLYNMVRKYNFEVNYTHQILMDMILESDSYKKMVQEKKEELPDYG